MPGDEQYGRCAAIVFDEGPAVDEIMCAFAQEMAARGVAVGGVAQVPPGHPARACAETLILLDLRTGDRIELMQKLGSGSKSCRLDPHALAQAASHVRAAIEAGARLILLSRFGEREAEGGGLRDELAYALEKGCAVLTAVKRPYAGDWRAFCGPDGRLLEHSAAALRTWWDEAAASAHPHDVR